MRLILSRKGFDSGTGRKPSPIFPDDRMVTLPIPERASATTYGQVKHHGQALGALVEALTQGRIQGTYGVHLDPDLDRASKPRKRGWMPSLGQCAAAQSVLARNRVGVGDVFLFFGWFKRVEVIDGVPAYERNAHDLHVLFGWLQVGRVVALNTESAPAWAADHPHVVQPKRKSNTLYVASSELALGGTQLGVPGAGTFSRFHPDLCLTAHGERRSVWSLPRWFHPIGNRPPLGYHDQLERWHLQEDETRLQSVARGQEFVLDTTHYPEAATWIKQLMKHA